MKSTAKPPTVVWRRSIMPNSRIRINDNPPPFERGIIIAYSIRSVRSVLTCGGHGQGGPDRRAAGIAFWKRGPAPYACLA